MISKNNNSKNDSTIKLDKIIKKLSEHRTKIKSYNKYINTLNDIALAALNDENILANTRIEFKIKSNTNKETNKPKSNPRDLLDLLTSSGTPEEFANNLDRIQDKIEQGRQHEKRWEEISLNLNDLDNKTFIAIVSSILDIIKKYKKEIDYKKMLSIVKDAGYNGYIGVEYEKISLSEEDGIIATKNLLLKAASEI